MLYDVVVNTAGGLLLCPQALLMLTSRLVIRRTLQEVVGEGYTVPQQHHDVVLVQPKHTHGFMLDLLKKAAKQVCAQQLCQQAADLPKRTWAPCTTQYMHMLSMAQSVCGRYSSTAAAAAA
jgi:hypothetical protein